MPPNVNGIGHAQNFSRAEENFARPNIVVGNGRRREGNSVTDNQIAPYKFTPRHHKKFFVHQVMNAFGYIVACKGWFVDDVLSPVADENFAEVGARHVISFAGDNIGVEIFCERVKFFQRGRREQIVVVHVENIFAARKLQADVSRSCAATGIFCRAREFEPSAELSRVTLNNRTT